MSRKDKPYLPLNVQDFLTDEKLIECSAATTGIYIRLMCILHKQDIYGKLLLKQTDKQTDKQTKNFALKLAKQMPYSVDEIEAAIFELFDNKIIRFEDDFLIQKRMFEDGQLSVLRSESGSRGGKKTQKFAKAKRQANTKANTKAKRQANTDNDIDTEIDIKRIKENTWRTNFDIYQDMCRGAYRELLNNENWIMDQEKYHPKFNIPLTVEACFKNFWATKAGWKNKKGNKTDDPDWPATIARTMDKNPVYK